MYNRNTYALIDLKAIKNNVSKIIKKYNNYKYYFGVVKADSYGHDGIEVVKAIIDGGCNYLCVATLDEALDIRKEIIDIPILCLGIIPIDHLDKCIENNITITISNIDYLKDIDISGLKCHIKINTGMNRLGISNEEELLDVYKMCINKGIYVEGVYSHLYDACNESANIEQLNRFSLFTSKLDLDNIPIVHLQASDGIINLEKKDFINGCRLGIIMYGFTSDKDLNLSSTFSLYSEVIGINHLNKGDTLGYGAKYIASGTEQIAVVSIGYADGVIRHNTNRFVYINDKRYQIVGNICMDMLFVKVDGSVKVGDKVLVLKDNEHILEVSNHLDTIPYEILCTVSKRVPRIYTE